MVIASCVGTLSEEIPSRSPLAAATSAASRPRTASTSLVKGAERAAGVRGWNLILCNSDEDVEREEGRDE